MQSDEIITSPRNPLLKRVRGLLRHEEREDTIAIEGLRAIIAAQRAEVVIPHLLYAPERLRSSLAQAAVAAAQASGTHIVRVAAEALDEVSARDASQGIVAIAQRPVWNFAALHLPPSPLIVALFEPQDPGNVGTIVRTADGAGAAALVLLGSHGVDPFHPRAVRASMGSIFDVPVVPLDPLPAAIATMREQGLRIIGAAGQGATDLWQADLGGATVLILGNERTGLPPDALAECDEVVRIPLFGQADSLNVAAAAAIFIFEAVRQRIANGAP